MSRTYNQFPAEWDGFLAEVVPTTDLDDALSRFLERFPDSGMTSERIRSWCSRHGVRVGRRRKQQSFWDADRDQFIRDYAPGHHEQEIMDEFERRFGVTVTLSQLQNRKVRLGVRSGTRMGFKKGHAPHNKGRPMAEWMDAESMERVRSTQFKMGHIGGSAKARMMPIGTERVSKDGYIEVKVRDGIQDKPNSNFEPKHVLVWQEANGRKVPKGHNVVFADKDKTNLDPGNLVLVDRRDWPYIQSHSGMYHDRETLELLVAKAKLSRTAYGRSLEGRVCRDCGRTFDATFRNQSRCRPCIDARRSDGR